jgi:hypothetical protein
MKNVLAYENHKDLPKLNSGPIWWRRLKMDVRSLTATIIIVLLFVEVCLLFQAWSEPDPDDLRIKGYNEYNGEVRVTTL